MALHNQWRSDIFSHDQISPPPWQSLLYQMRVCQRLLPEPGSEQSWPQPCWTFVASGSHVWVAVSSTTMLAASWQMLIREWDAVPQQSVGRLVTSMKRRREAVTVCFTCDWASCLKRCQVVNKSLEFRHSKKSQIGLCRSSLKHEQVKHHL